MCGRFTLRTPSTVLIEHFDLDVRGDRQLAMFEPRYNIAPTQDIVVIRALEASSKRDASPMRWGLVPSWAKELAGGPPQINARSETLAEKPMFRTAFRRRRCLIPADGFFEWQADHNSTAAKPKKQPFYIHRPDNRPFAFAGLWETWHGPGGKTQSPAEASPVLESCTIVTTSANRTLSGLHDRMPVILSPHDYATWLDPDIEDTAALQKLLTPCGENELIAEPVSTHVNRVANNDARCIAVQRGLFD
jgi:putative SOS response-associated peptidase YedK